MLIIDITDEYACHFFFFTNQNASEFIAFFAHLTICLDKNAPVVVTYFLSKSF